MADLTFSSPLGAPAFTSFTLDISASQATDQLRDESALRFGFSISGSGARAAHAKLAPIETKVLLNGEPSMTLEGLIVGAAIGQGALVKVQADLWQRGAANNKETLSIVGVVTNLVWTATQSTLTQRVDFVLQKCQRLHVRSGGTVTSTTDPAVS